MWRRLPFLVAALAFLIALPSVGAGLSADDFYHRSALLGSEAFDDFAPAPLDLFRSPGARLVGRTS